MTNEEAIKTLEANYPDACFEQLREAVDAAIEALKAQELANNSPKLDSENGDLIRRQDAINVLEERLQANGYTNVALVSELNRSIGYLMRLPSAQSDMLVVNTEDLIVRGDAIKAVNERIKQIGYDNDPYVLSIRAAVADVPSAQPTLHGYKIEHLKLIARVMQKEDLLLERVVEALTDIGRIVAIVRDEFEETLRKAVEQCRN